MRSILVTGFEPFGGDTVNPSAEIARALQGREIRGHRIETAVVPCVFARAPAALREAIATHDPALVLLLGQASGIDAFEIERVAVNLIDARIADNAGAQPIDEPVQADAPAACFATLPVKAMWSALRDAGFPARVSLSAGSFVCNQLFYALMHEVGGRGLPAGLVHVPLLPQQGQPSIALATQVDAMALALDAALRGDAGPRVSAGTLN